MATIARIQEILQKAKHGQYVSLLCNGQSADVKATVVQLKKEKVQAISAEAWTEGWPHDTVALKIDLVWNSTHTHPDLELKVNGVNFQFGEIVQVEKGSDVTLYVYSHLEGRTHFTRYSDEPADTDHNVAEYTRTLKVNEATTLQAIFTECPPI